VAWLFYVAGYATAFEHGVNRNLDTIYSNASLRIKFLELLSKNDLVRASNALEAAIRSDLSIMKEYEKTASKMSYMDTLKSSLSGFDQYATSPSKLDAEEIERLEAKFNNIVIQH